MSSLPALCDQVLASPIEPSGSYLGRFTFKGIALDHLFAEYCFNGFPVNEDVGDSPHLPTQCAQYRVGIEHDRGEQIPIRRVLPITVGDQCVLAEASPGEQVQLFQVLLSSCVDLNQVDTNNLFLLDRLLEEYVEENPFHAVGEYHPVDSLVAGVVHR